MSRSLQHLAMLAVAVVTLACADRATSGETRQFLRDEADVGAPSAAMAPHADRTSLVSKEMAVTDRQASGTDAVSAATNTAAAQGTGATASMIIRTGSASVVVDSLEPAIAAVERIATSLGGWVGNTTVSTGAFERRSATIELKIPAARYDEALLGLRPLGKVESVTSMAEDVGEEFVDLSARTANARRLEERIVALLATRTGKLEDVLAVERELARVREEIERYEGRLRYLRTRVATSTLTVTVHEPAPLVSATPGESVLGEAFKDAWRNFVRFVAAFIASLGTVVPVLVLAAIAIAAWRRLRRPASST